MSWRELVVTEAKTWLGTPYQPKGRKKGIGVDCGGILYEVYNPHFGPFASFPKEYAPDWALHRPDELYLDFIMPYVEQVPIPVVGGFSLFHVGQAWSHAGIYIGDNQYIHAWGRMRKGSVTKTPLRVMRHMSSPHEPKHFDPKVR